MIFHGYGASPADHWFGWCADRLTREGIPPTKVPPLPDPESPSPYAWAHAVARELSTPGPPGSIVIAHSLGCLAVLRHLASLTGEWTLGALVLVSEFTDTLPALPVLDDFIGDGVDVSAIAEHVNALTVLRSDDDPYVPTDHTDRLAQLLGVRARVVPGAGHFLASEGVTTLPWCSTPLSQRRRSSVARHFATLDVMWTDPRHAMTGNLAADVRAAIAALPDDLAELVRLVHWEGFSITEAAQICGVPASTARTRYQRARRALAARLRAPTPVE